ncbi:MAG TPA: hypothetical protein VGH05_13690 [Buttiauxella sp.]|jgi:hypothetical protein
MKKAYLITAAMLIFIFVAYPLYRSHQEKVFSCTAHFQSNYNDTYLRAMFRLTFQGTEGTASLRGEVKDSQDKILPLSRVIFFTFSENDQIYKIRSENISRENTDRVDDDLLSKLVDSFYLKEDETVQYHALRQPNGDYIVYNGSLPLIYCHKNENL